MVKSTEIADALCQLGSPHHGKPSWLGHSALSDKLPGGGWSVGALLDLLLQQAGIGELRLLRPALSAAGNRPIAFVQPPHTPDGLGLTYIGLSLEQVLANALWPAEEILRAGSCGALIFRTLYAQASSLRRLHFGRAVFGNAFL